LVLPAWISKITLQPIGYTDIIRPVGYIDKASWLHFPDFFQEGNPMDLKQFGMRLKELRSQAGMTQEQLAERAGVKRDAVARWERGVREPSWSNVLALAAALEEPLEAFTVPPGDVAKPRRGRPPKPAAQEQPEEPKRPRGRPHKEK
jgi:transcriptional regulator with XRE-family HTH domain